MPQHGIGDFNKVITGACSLKQRAKQHEQKDEARGNPKCNAKHALSAQPLVRRQLTEAHAFMGNHIRHIGAGNRVCDEDRSNDSQREPERPTRGFQQKHETDKRNPQILGDRRAGPR